MLQCSGQENKDSGSQHYIILPTSGDLRPLECTKSLGFQGLRPWTPTGGMGSPLYPRPSAQSVRKNHQCPPTLRTNRRLWLFEQQLVYVNCFLIRKMKNTRLSTVQFLARFARGFVDFLCVLALRAVPNVPSNTYDSPTVPKLTPLPPCHVIWCQLWRICRSYSKPKSDITSYFFLR